MVDDVKESNKKAEKEEAALEAMRTRCKTCFKEVAPKRVCGGHGGGGGGGGEESDDTAEASPDSNDTTLTTESTETSGDNDAVFEDYEAVRSADKSQTDEASFDAAIIAALIEKGLLVVDSDRDAMTLTIALTCEPNELSAEERQALKQFMQAILKELDAFKKENDISVDCVEIEKDDAGNIRELCITLPTLELYDAFIQRLANNLLPEKALDNKEQLDADESAEYTKPFNPSPFSKEP